MSKLYIKDQQIELAIAIRENKEVLFGSLRGGVTMKAKEKIWEKIREQAII